MTPAPSLSVDLYLPPLSIHLYLLPGHLRCNSNQQSLSLLSTRSWGPTRTLTFEILIIFLVISAGRLFACAYFPFKEQLSWLQTRSCWLQTPHHSTSFATRSTRLAISSLALWTSPYVRLSFGSLPFDLLCMPDFLLWSLFFRILKVFQIVRKKGTEHNQIGKTWREGGIHLYSATWTTCYVSHAHIVQILKRTWFYVKEKIFAKNYSTQLINIILKGLYLAQGPSQRLKLCMFKV